MRCPICLVAAVATVMWVTFPLRAAEYYVDFDGGKDSAAGTSADQAWKHSPGDPAAEGGPKAAKLGPGDTVLFKGSVVYRGTIAIGAGGAEGKPLVFDGNSGRFGQGRAIIDGSQDPSAGGRAPPPRSAPATRIGRTSTGPPPPRAPASSPSTSARATSRSPSRRTPSLRTRSSRT